MKLAPGTRVTTPDGPGTVAEAPFQMASGWTALVDLDRPVTASGHCRYGLDEIEIIPAPLPKRVPGANRIRDAINRHKTNR